MAFKTNYSNCRHNFGRTRPVARFEGLEGQNTFLWGKDFSIYHMFETNFSEHNKIWGPQKHLGVTAPECLTVSAGLGRTVARKSSIAGLHVCAGGLDILKIYFLIN